MLNHIVLLVIIIVITSSTNIHGLFPLEHYSSYQIDLICLHFNFRESIQHLSFMIRTVNKSHYQLDLRLINLSKQWQLLLQQDDYRLRLKSKFEELEDCPLIQFNKDNIKTIQDLTIFAEEYIVECNSFKFHFKYISEIETISEWESMLDFEYEKALQRVNCMAFTDYIMRKITNDNQRRKIKKMILRKGEELLEKYK